MELPDLPDPLPVPERVPEQADRFVARLPIDEAANGEARLLEKPTVDNAADPE